MGKMKELLIGNATNEEKRAMVDNIRDQHQNGYIAFLENKLKEAEKIIKTIKEIHITEQNIDLNTNTITTLIDLYFHDDNNKKESLNGNKDKSTIRRRIS